MLVSYTWLKDYVGDSLPAPDEVVSLLTEHAFEVEGVEQVGDDTVIDVDVLPNRASDCLCHRGIARELASIIDTKLTHDPLVETPNLTDSTELAVAIADTKACPRFTASVIRSVTVGESPDWLKDRLVAIGQRPINNIVDATNYVMFALGQPLHAYDADLFPQSDGSWQFGVRYARAGESIDLIAESGTDEDRTVALDGNEVLVVDGSSDTPIGLAGVKGGRFAGVHGDTVNVIIEAAHFHPTITRKTARRLGIVIDASKRFENEPSRELPPYAQAAIVSLITDIAGGTYAGTTDVYEETKKNPTVTINPERVNALLGLSLSVEEMSDILVRIGCRVERDGAQLQATGPFERTDLQIEEDFIEEVGRIYGYEHVSAVVPEPVPLPEYNARHYYSENIRACLTSLGFSEVITSSFKKKDTVQLKNALASDKSCLRSNLTANIADALDRNASLTDLLGITDTRMFEIGTVFETSDDGIAEHVSVALGVRVRPSGYSGKEDTILTEALTALEGTLGVPLNAHVQKGIAEFDLTALLQQLPAPTAYDEVVVGKEITYQPFSSYPHITRDIALWVAEGTDPEDVAAVLNAHAGPLRVRTDLFDTFTKDERTSYAFRLVFQSHEKTLTDAEVNEFMNKVYEAVAEKGWEVR